MNFLRPIVKEHNIALINLLINNDIVKMDDFVNEVIDTNEPECIYCFARDIDGAPIDKLTDAIIATKNSKFIYLLFC